MSINNCNREKGDCLRTKKHNYEYNIPVIEQVKLFYIMKTGTSMSVFKIFNTK